MADVNTITSGTELLRIIAGGNLDGITSEVELLRIIASGSGGGGGASQQKVYNAAFMGQGSASMFGTDGVDGFTGSADDVGKEFFFMFDPGIGFQSYSNLRMNMMINGNNAAAYIIGIKAGQPAVVTDVFPVTLRDYVSEKVPVKMRYFFNMYGAPSWLVVDFPVVLT